MPFFQGASGFNISGGEFNDIAGNLTKTDSSTKTTNTDSYNTKSETSTNSNNDNSKRLTVDPPSQHISVLVNVFRLFFDSEKAKPVKQGKKSGVH